MIGMPTRGHTIVGADESTELWRPLKHLNRSIVNGTTVSFGQHLLVQGMLIQYN